MNGTTGESVSLTVEERKLLLETWNSVADGRYRSCNLSYSVFWFTRPPYPIDVCRLTIIAHVGTENLKNTCELVRD